MDCAELASGVQRLQRLEESTPGPSRSSAPAGCSARSAPPRERDFQLAAPFVPCRPCSTSSPHKTAPPQGAPCWMLCRTSFAPSRSSSWPVREPALGCAGSLNWVASGPDESTGLASSLCAKRLTRRTKLETTEREGVARAVHSDSCLTSRPNEHLAEADRHIAEAHASIAEMEEAIGTNRHTGPEPAGLLETMKGTLRAFEAHRALILRKIEDIKGRGLVERFSLQRFLRVLRHLGVEGPRAESSGRQARADRTQVWPALRPPGREGAYQESDDFGRSLAQDVRKAAKTVAKPGQGDKGDKKKAPATKGR